MSSAAGLNKTFSFFLQKYHLWPFSGTEVQLQSRFFQPRRNFWNILEESYWEHCTKRRVVCFYRHVISACQHFPKTVILANCISAVRPFVACYAGFFNGFLICFTLPIIRFFSKCYSLTNRQKTAFFDNFALTQAFFSNFLPLSSKWENIVVISSFQRRYSVQTLSVYDISSLFCFVVHPGWFLNENMSSPAGLNKTFSFFWQKYHFWPFSGTEVQLQSRFIQPRRIFWNILEESYWEHCAKRRVVCFYKHVSSACQHFPKSVILANCISAVRPFVAC